MRFSGKVSLEPKISYQTFEESSQIQPNKLGFNYNYTFQDTHLLNSKNLYNMKLTSDIFPKLKSHVKE